MAASRPQDARTSDGVCVVSQGEMLAHVLLPSFPAAVVEGIPPDASWDGSGADVSLLALEPSALLELACAPSDTSAASIPPVNARPYCTMVA